MDVSCGVVDCGTASGGGRGGGMDFSSFAGFAQAVLFRFMHKAEVHGVYQSLSLQRAAWMETGNARSLATLSEGDRLWELVQESGIQAAQRRWPLMIDLQREANKYIKLYENIAGQQRMGTCKLRDPIADAGGPFVLICGQGRKFQINRIFLFVPQRRSGMRQWRLELSYARECAAGLL
ncbi:unnamed protein product [Symbiodinium sp. KB8]|nr:unnamed protein product [Symbiodinium sp. KB8]